MTLQSFLTKVEANSKGFLIFGNQKIFFSSISGKILEESVKGKNIDDVLLSMPEGKFSWKSYALEENSLLIIIGHLEHTKDELDILAKILHKAQISPNDELLSSIIFLRKKESLEELIKTGTYDKNYSKTNYQSEYDVDDKSKSTVQIPKTLTEKLDEFILTKLDLKTFESAENNFDKTKSLIVSLLIEQFLTSTYNYQAEDISGKDMLDITFMSNFPKCNICSSFRCKHVDIVLSDKHVLSHLKKDNVIPVRFDLTKFKIDIKNMIYKETEIENKSKTKTNQI